MPKNGANEPCPCKSGKKFKKCCRDKPGSSFAPQEPKFSREFVNRLFARDDELKKTRLQTGPEMQTDTSFGRLFAVGASLYRPETKQTFHQFLIDHLIQVLSRRWYETESERPHAEWHPVLRWLQGSEQYLNAATPKAIYGRIHSFHPDGNGQALLTLADDVYQLAHIMKTPDKPILKRLRNRRSFQGARYEIFTASSAWCK